MEKNCEFENVTPAELIASKFLSVIGRSTGDSELKKKIRKSDMTIKTITALIHEHMYDRLNDSNNSSNGRKTKHVEERPYKAGAQIITKRSTNSSTSTRPGGTRIKPLKKHDHLERATEITEDCFVSPAVITVKTDKSVKFALDSRKLNKITVKSKAQMPDMVELISRISKKHL